ncbi:hypothetical protein SCHPADRAFT_661803 [Schizopora paradoxa]|uniref:Uncharacterized protein n=1 Tax=Schizopora paradoxa TaxID=27342 RepID=A0A0H2R5P7_9AGAM|nr:hypothetical protein SCHPADRAFT_661803 [Schizopora paradoxa]
MRMVSYIIFALFRDGVVHFDVPPGRLSQTKRLSEAKPNRRFTCSTLIGDGRRRQPCPSVLSVAISSSSSISHHLPPSHLSSVARHVSSWSITRNTAILPVMDSRQKRTTYPFHGIQWLLARAIYPKDRSLDFWRTDFKACSIYGNDDWRG